VAPPKRITREGVLAKVSAAFAGAAAPSMDGIAAAAGVSRAALYALFGSRAALLEAVGADVPPTAAGRILAAAAEMVAERGLAGLSLDEVATRSGASRATVYRLYPGKAALFREVVLTYLPIGEALEMMEGLADRPPTEVMPAFARGLAQSGPVRIGVLRTIMFEVARPTEGMEEFLDETLRNTQVITRYLDQQMAAGRLRRMDPMLAMQAFLAPVMLHAVSRPVAEQYGLVTLSLDDAAQELTAAWLRAMAPPRHRRAQPVDARPVDAQPAESDGRLHRRLGG
jgi:AcrR family transcriptional regulator